MKRPGEAPRSRPAGLSGVHDGLMVLWLALIAADRIDLMGHAGGFTARPSLFLTPIVVLSELQRRAVLRRPVSIPRAGLGYATLAFVLLGLIGASVLVSPETTVSAGRAGLLAADLLGSMAVVMTAWDREDLGAVFDRGAVAGVLLYCAFNVAQLASLAGVLPDTLHVGPAVIFLYPSTYGAIVPRLSGMVIDQNRSGFVLLFYGWWMAFPPNRAPRAGYLGLIAVLMVLTLSRSGAVAALATLVVLVLERRVRWAPRRSLVGAGLVASAGLAVLVLSARVRAAAGDWLAPFALRLSVDEGSSKAHLTLISRGIDVATSSISHLALGIGYGSAFRVLEDVFPGNRYGNFHSLYVTMLAECGIFALTCILVIMGVPMVRGGPLRALVVGAAVFSVFYQATSEPAFWALLTMAWLSLPPRVTASAA